MKKKEKRRNNTWLMLFTEPLPAQWVLILKSALMAAGVRPAQLSAAKPTPLQGHRLSSSEVGDAL